MRVVDYLKWKYDLQLDRNGYGESILTLNHDKCFLCDDVAVTRHEIVFGTADRKKSKALGLWIPICAECHREAHRNRKVIDDLHVLAQQECDKFYGDGVFFEVYGENYVD